MRKVFFVVLGFILFFSSCLTAHGQFEQDILETSAGDLKITFLGHGTLMLSLDQKIIHVDPWSKVADYTLLPQADIILITHEHRDHLDLQALSAVRNENTETILTEKCFKQLQSGKIMKNGDTLTAKGIVIEAVPAYNLIHKRDNGQPFHPRGEGNGYILTIGGKRIYIAGDTENITEMKSLKAIDCAFLPMNLPYTMTPEMVADAAKAFKPKILYPYHYGKTDTAKLVSLLADSKEIEVRIRRME